MLDRQLPTPIVYLLLAAFSLLCFGLVAESVASDRPITVFDVDQAERFWQISLGHPAVRDFALWITDLGSGRPRTIVIVGVALILIRERQCRLAIFWGLTQWLLRELVAVSKDAFARPRPHFEGNTYVAGAWSFPSGHAAGAMTTYGMIAFLIAMRWAGRWFCWPAALGLGAIILLVGLSRMMLGVHYFTDVMGGYFLGLGYISLCIAAIAWWRPKNCAP